MHSQPTQKEYTTGNAIKRTPTRRRCRLASTGDVDNAISTLELDESANVPRPQGDAVGETRGSVGSTDLKLCLFFQQKTKKINRKMQDLRNITTFAACEAIYSAAQIRKDKRIMLEMQPGPGLPDSIAREVMYHAINIIPIRTHCLVCWTLKYCWKMNVAAVRMILLS